MPASNKFWFPLALIAVALVASLWWISNTPENPAAPDHSTVMPGSSKPAAATAGPLDTVFAHLRQKPERADALQSLKQLQAALIAMPRDEALAWIRDFIASGQDQTTGLSFEIASDGSLKEWPTFRTFLLDTILTIDPSAAAALGRAILTKPTSADEWALALRNVGKVEKDGQANAYLVERTEALIANPAWQANPSIGYLNAFDVLVHTRATASTPLLSGLIQQKDRRDLAHAGFLTLDRLVQCQPLEVLPQLATDKALQASRPEMVAQQFAHADLRDPAQQQIVRSYLLDPARSGTELRSFAGVFPNNNRFISNNLLTSEAQQSGAELGKHDREVLEIVKGWAVDPAMQPIAGTLRSMLERLNGFVTTPPPPGSP